MVFFMTNVNGKLLEDSQAMVALNNRGLNYGDAVFETMRFAGGKIYFWEDHYFRLMASMRILRMEIPMTFTMEFLEEEILKVFGAQRDDSKGYRVKLLVWRKTGGKYTPKNREVEYSISYEEIVNPFYSLAEKPYEVELFKDHFINSGLLSTIKSTNRIINILGGIFAEENDYDNCLLLNENKQVVEALNGNLFLVAGNTVKTPPLADGCINGILRKQLLAILKLMPEFTVEESSISPFELQKADELFITNVVGGIRPITKYRKKQFVNTLSIELVQKLNLRARMGV